jgi:hypothetical protein
MMEAASTSETSVNFYQTTWRNDPEDSNLRTCRRENLNLTLNSLTSQRNALAIGSPQYRQQSLIYADWFTSHHMTVSATAQLPPAMSSGF